MEKTVVRSFIRRGKMAIRDEKLKELHNKKQDLMRKFDRKQIEDNDYCSQISEINKEIADRTRQVLDENKETKLKTNKEENKMADEESKVKEKKAGREASKTSVPSVVAKVLGMKSIKNVDDAVEKVVEETSVDKAKAKSRIKTIIRECKAGKGRWAKYSWDEETFTMAEK